MEGYKTPPFNPYYHRTDYIVATSGEAPQEAVNGPESVLANVSKHSSLKFGIKSLSTVKDFKDYVWQFSGPLHGFKGYFNRVGG